MKPIEKWTEEDIVQALKEFDLMRAWQPCYPEVNRVLLRMIEEMRREQK